MPTPLLCPSKGALLALLSWTFYKTMALSNWAGTCVKRGRDSTGGRRSWRRSVGATLESRRNNKNVPESDLGRILDSKMQSRFQQVRYRRTRLRRRTTRRADSFRHRCEILRVTFTQNSGSTCMVRAPVRSLQGSRRTLFAASCFALARKSRHLYRQTSYRSCHWSRPARVTPRM